MENKQVLAFKLTSTAKLQEKDQKTINAANHILTRHQKVYIISQKHH